MDEWVIYLTGEQLSIGVKVQNSLDRLYTMLSKVATERLANIERGRTWNEELEGISKDEIRNEIRNKDTQLYDAKNQVEELNEKLLSASSQLPQSPPSAPESSPPPKVSPASTPHIPSKRLQVLAPPSSPSRHQCGSELLPRRLLIMLFIFLVPFLVLYFYSLSQQANENINTWEAASEVSQEEGVHSGSRDDRMR